MLHVECLEQFLANRFQFTVYDIVARAEFVRNEIDVQFSYVEHVEYPFLSVCQQKHFLQSVDFVFYRRTKETVNRFD